MAPAMPEVPMDQVQAMNLKVTYWMLFQYMLQDFVHRQDLPTILAANTVNTVVNGGAAPPPDYIVKGALGVGQASFGNFTNAAAVAQGKVYDAAVKAGKGFTEGITTGLESALS